MATGWVSHERYLWHDTQHFGGILPAVGYLEPYEHAENPATKRRIANLVEISGLRRALTTIDPRPATRDEVLRVHAPAHVERLEQASAEAGGDAGDGGSPFGPGGYDIARLAAGGAIAAVDAVLDGGVENAFALVRPPGHHAEPATGMGFCLINNVAIAVRHAQAQRGIGRVAVVDWDVHHGNGTQAVFYDDPSVLTISLHQDGCFPPGSGDVEDRGAGAGVGANLNVPLPPGSGTQAYLDAMDRVVLPALHAHGPELVVVASGLDAGALDPLARMMLHSDSYRELCRRVLDAAGTLCAGRLVVVHEGGYSAYHVPFLALAVLETLAGQRTDVEDPFLPLVLAQRGQELEPHQAAAVDRAAQVLTSNPIGAEA